ncbi:hypothetical protein ABBQ32_003969 [Trebouxia sp. C0010 RCD-2024]
MSRSSMSRYSAGASLFLAAALLFTAPFRSHANLDWESMTSQIHLQKGDGTSYGSGQDYQGTCSYGSNMANTNDLPWSSGLSMTVAMNDDQFGSSVACGMCVTFQGTGSGIGTMPIPGGGDWLTALVTNRCPECARGALDQAINGNGRWGVQWYATPCPVGDSTLVYSITVIDQYWFSLVVSNTFVPLKSVEYNIDGQWWSATRSVNNQWPYHREVGDFSFPMPIRVTSVAGQVLEDIVPSSSGGWGKKQFTETGIDTSKQTLSNYFSTTGPDGTAALDGAKPTGNTDASSPSSTSSSSSSASSSSQSSSSSSDGSSSQSSSSDSSSGNTASSPASSPDTADVKLESPVTDSITIQSPGNEIVPNPLPYVKPYTVVNYGQCGGTSEYCNKVNNCVDAVWTGASCNSGWQCNRYDESWWQCQPSSRRLSRRMRLQ